LKNIKAPGTDLIQAELIKDAGAEYIKHLHQLLLKYGLQKQQQRNGM
jgi:hypothetical protein